MFVRVEGSDVRNPVSVGKSLLAAFGETVSYPTRVAADMMMKMIMMMMVVGDIGPQLRQSD